MQLLSVSIAAARARDAGLSVGALFHKLYFAEWCVERNDSRDIAIRYVERGVELPWQITFEEREFKMGQCSGPSYGWVTYDAVSA